MDDSRVKSDPDEIRIKQEQEDDEMGGGKGMRDETHTPMERDPPIEYKPEIRPEIKQEIKEEPGESSVPETDKTKRIFVFKPEDLRQALMPTLEKLARQDPESLPFRQPVDAQALGIPDYFDIVTKPIDLATIKMKLDRGEYKDPWEYVDDVWLMFDNAWLYNRKNSRVYRYCTKVSEFDKQHFSYHIKLRYTSYFGVITVSILLDVLVISLLPDVAQFSRLCRNPCV